MGNRKEVEKLIVTYIGKLVGKENKDLYEELFKNMSNKDFEEFMLGLKNDKITLSVIVPNMSKIKVTVDNNIKVGKELGHDFFQHIKIEGSDNPDYMTPNKYLVYKLPIRRAAQLLSKKISIPKDNKSVDLTTGQVTGSSKGSKISLPEIQLMTGMGMTESLKELVKYRGGDQGSLRAMNASLIKTGQVDNKTLDEYSTKVESTKTLKKYWLASHIKSTL